MAEIKKIDNTFRIKENVIPDKPEDDNFEIKEVKKEKSPREKHIISKVYIDRENGQIHQKSKLVRKRVKNLPDITTNMMKNDFSFDPNTELFGFAGELCDPFRLVCINLPNWTDFLNGLGIGNFFTEIGNTFESLIKGLEGIIDLSGINRVIKDIQRWDPLTDLTNAFEDFDLGDILTDIITALLKPFMWVVGLMIQFSYEVMEPTIIAHLPAAGSYFLYLYLIPALLLASTALSAVNDGLSMVNQIRGVEL